MLWEIAYFTFFLPGSPLQKNQRNEKFQNGGEIAGKISSTNYWVNLCLQKVDVKKNKIKNLICFLKQRIIVLYINTLIKSSVSRTIYLHNIFSNLIN